ATGAPTAATGATGPTVANSGVGQAINDANAGAAAGNADANRAGSSTADAAALCQSAPTLTDLAAAAAGLEVINYNLTFEGSYFKLHEVFGRLMDLVRTRNGKVRTVGRLVQINSIALSVGDFPKLQASVAMTGYQLPSTISATAGATPAGPAGAPAPTAAPAATTPPQAVAGAR
ncbi:MAG TPA: hypothetical protein VGO97_01550, partial [Solirubrobacterales bacterium]|nr:hypothetical protein [Solirubrobacterales bacterium]